MHRPSLAPATGMHDVLPPASVQRRHLADELVRSFSRFGYERVIAPPFEPARRMEHGLSLRRQDDVVRFVEPETGEVAAFRPDITPQVARIVATRLRNRPPPYRLSYEGTVIRRGDARTRGPEQIDQAGIECVGLEGVDTDAEILEIVATSCASIGLRSLCLELGQVEVPLYLLREVPKGSAEREALALALTRKDVAELERLARASGIGRKRRNQLLALPELYGDTSVLRRAKRRFRTEPALVSALDDLDRLLDRLQDRLQHRLPKRTAERCLTVPILLDLGKLPQHAYYSGMCFTGIAPGPGRPIASGGRYDALLAGFGMPSPACGAALDLGCLEQALGRGAQLPPRPIRLVAAGTESAWLAPLLRDQGFSVARLPCDRAQGLAYANQWNYDAVILIAGDRKTLQANVCANGSSARFPSANLETLQQWLEQQLKQTAPLGT